MAKRMNKLAILAMIEATSGTLAAPVAANAIEVSDVTLTPLEGDEASQGVIRPFFGASEKILVTQYRKVAFSVGFAGVAVAGDLPGYEALLRACAASATNTPAPSPNAGTVFAPVTDNLQSLTIIATLDKLVYKMSGARGNCKIVVDAKGIPRMQFEFTGAFIPVEDAAQMPAVNYSKFMRPVGVNKLNTTMSLAGYDTEASSFNLDFGNKVVKQDLMNVDSTEITGRESSASVTFRNTDVATKDWIDLARTGAKVPLVLKHGQGETNTISIAAPLAQVGKPSFSDQDGIQMITIPLMLIPSDAGNDEWTITV